MILEVDRIFSKAFFGGELIGDNAVRYIYVDEAGTSAHEPITIVVGIIIHADRHWKLAEAEVRKVLDLVPQSFRRDFIFHAKTVWGSNGSFRIIRPSCRVRLQIQLLVASNRVDLPKS